eukprot:447757_1
MKSAVKILALVFAIVGCVCPTTASAVLNYFLGHPPVHPVQLPDAFSVTWSNNPRHRNRLQIKTTLPKNPPGAVYLPEYTLVGYSQNEWMDRTGVEFDSGGVATLDFEFFVPERVRIAILYKGKKYWTQPYTVPIFPVQLPDAFSVTWSNNPRHRNRLQIKTTLPKNPPPGAVYRPEYTVGDSPHRWEQQINLYFDSGGVATFDFETCVPTRARITIYY